MKAPLPRIFDGQVVVVVAGGPSLLDFDWSRLAGLHVIAINRALEFVPGADVLWWSDAGFWRRNRDLILAHAAPIKATCQVNYLPEDDLPSDVVQYNFTGGLGFDERPGCLRHGNNSTYAAIHLAAHLGAARIVLLGVDMRYGPAGESHFHGGHGLIHSEATLTELMLPHFEPLVKPLQQRGITVVNASPDSALRCWPRCSIDEGLAIASAALHPNPSGLSPQGGA